MSTVRQREYLSVQDYLDDERVAKRKHEYVDGITYAQAGATNSHNSVATNILATLHSQLRGKPCRPFNLDTKIRIRQATGTRFYYPDAIVVCQPNPPEDVFQDAPALIAEVISPNTRRTDEKEKRDAYQTIQSLCVYMLIEQSSTRVVVYRRMETSFQREIYTGLAATIPLPEIDCSLNLSAIYEDVLLVEESEESPEDE